MIIHLVHLTVQRGRATVIARLGLLVSLLSLSQYACIGGKWIHWWTLMDPGYDVKLYLVVRLQHGKDGVLGTVEQPFSQNCSQVHFDPEW